MAVSSSSKSIRIVSDGTGLRTQIFDDQGRDISRWVRSVTWTMEAGGMAEAVLTFSAVEVDVTALNSEYHTSKLVPDPDAEEPASAE